MSHGIDVDMATCEGSLVSITSIKVSFVILVDSVINCFNPDKCNIDLSSLLSFFTI